MGAEYEVKFQGCPALPGPWETISMETVYYDTPSGSLSEKKYMLRHRLENGRHICTLKTPGKQNLRGEWEAESPDILEAVDVLCKLGCPAQLAELAKEGLVPICGARFTRRCRLLEHPEFTAELALDQGVLFSGSRELPLLETELELKSGSRQALDAFAQSFARQHGLAEEEKSKFARALALYKEVGYGPIGLLV